MQCDGNDLRRPGTAWLSHCSTVVLDVQCSFGPAMKSHEFRLLAARNSGVDQLGRSLGELYLAATG